nr:MAG TPA: hypothetical protein [Caudoviricetes sp.]
MRDFGTAPLRTAVLSELGRVIASPSAWFDSTISRHTPQTPYAATA